MKTKIAIIGGGAAGCFCAINIKERMPEAEVCIFESKSKALAKVAITGGGRCNLTNSFRLVKNMKDVYPRGDKLMQRALMRFSNNDTCQWFEHNGVRLVVQDDECVFPKSQDAMEIVNTLLRLIKHYGISIYYNNKVTKIEHNDSQFSITNSENKKSQWDKVVVTTGGHPTLSGFDMLSSLGVNICPPVPSLFTLNIKGDWHQALMGTVVENVCTSIAGTKFRANGPLLLTHWGMSGPAILKLSSHGAKYLAEQNYRCKIVVNWCGEMGENEVRKEIESLASRHQAKLITSAYPHQFTARHWSLITERASIPSTQRWGSLNNKQINRLTSVLSADVYEVNGRYPHKEEFVTCGGVSLKDIDINTMQSKKIPGLFFAGEVLDIDAVTGGFNLQAAWSTAYCVAMNL